MVQMFPIIIPRPDLVMSANKLAELTGREIGRELDARSVSTNTLPGYLALIDEVTGGQGENHLHFSFLIEVPMEVACQHNSALQVSAVAGGRAVIMSGSLRQWVDAIRGSSKPTTWPEIRDLFNTAQWFFEQARFHNLFPDKHSLGDGTWHLAKQ